ncbi:MAG: hypothetical protein MJ033_06275 [Victivallaceae bacterium]|nr:hypothetical protein [Victivallaceae bacterium]
MSNELAELAKKRTLLNKEMLRVWAEAKERKIIPHHDKFASEEYLQHTRKVMAESESALKRFYELDLAACGPKHFSRENVYIWGGPTPSWGGSMEKETSIKAMKYFDADNVMYVYGPLNDEMMQLHKDCKKVICHLGRNCRTEGAAMASDVEEAELLSKLSLQYPNIEGGVIDDMAGNYGAQYSRKEYQAIYAALHKYNPKLKLYGVVYAHEFVDMTRELNAVADCIDHVILWFWRKLELPELDLTVEKCRTFFSGKPIMLGIFMFDYGNCYLPNSAETMHYHLEKARRLLEAGKIQDIVILGDREIEKCPAAAEYVRDFLKQEFSAE